MQRITVNSFVLNQLIPETKQVQNRLLNSTLGRTVFDEP
jgi:hypothetical protein